MPTPSITFPCENDLPLLTLAGGEGLICKLLPHGSVYAIECGGVLINQLLGDPLMGSASGIWLRVREAEVVKAVRVNHARGTGRSLTHDDASMAIAGSDHGLSWRCELILDKHQSRFAWMLHATNTANKPIEADAVWMQDLGLTSRFMARLNELYVSQYLDHRVLTHEQLGPMVATRQNLTVDGKHPWMLLGVDSGGVAAMTDAAHWLGAAHRDSHTPVMLREKTLPTQRTQGEHAAAVLQGRPVTIQPGQSVTWRFGAVFVADHPHATGEDDTQRWGDWTFAQAHQTQENKLDRPRTTPAPELDATFESLTLDEPSLRIQVQGEHRHVERRDGLVQSFFVHDHAHVVTRDKELHARRPTGHILRSGEGVIPSEEHLCCTCWMRGVFASHVALGNTSFGKMLSIARSPMDAIPAGGLRIQVRSKIDPTWRWLTVPSTFSMTRAGCAWSYIAPGSSAAGSIHLLITADASPGAPLLDFALYVLAGEAVEARLVSWVALGNHELDQRGDAHIDAERGLVTLKPQADTSWIQHVPGACFGLFFKDSKQLAHLGGATLLGLQDDHAPLVVAQSMPMRGVTSDNHEPGMLRWRIAGSTRGDAALQEALQRPEEDAASAGRRWRGLVPTVLLRHADERIGRLHDVLPWFGHNAVIHLSSPHGLEQNSGAAWGTRDVCQGPVEFLSALDRFDSVRAILCKVFANQFSSEESNGHFRGRGHFRGGWPQWFMHEPFSHIRPDEAHGDVIVWPLLALADYLENTGDFAVLEERLPFVTHDTHKPTQHAASLLEHVRHALDHMDERRVGGTALPQLGEGDWNDALQAADPLMRRQLVSGWTVPLTVQALTKLAVAMRHARRDASLVNRLEATAGAMSRDYQRFIIKDGQAAGLVRFEHGKPVEWLLHPSDTRTGIHHRLLAAERGVLGGLFTPEQATHHVKMIETHLLAPDGARLMTHPPRYHGGLEGTFKRAESAAAFSREIGLMYVHAHLRYAELRAVLGHGEALLEALSQVNPVGLQQSVPNAQPRQANAYFSSSDACFAHRDEADARYAELMRGEVKVEGGWRVYSSGPGIFVGVVVRRLLGLRRRLGCVVIDPVLPASLDGLEAVVPMLGATVAVRYRLGGVLSASLNGQALPVAGREPNPYRAGGLLVPMDAMRALMKGRGDVLEVGYTVSVEGVQV